MATIISANTIAMPDFRSEVEDAVLRGVGERDEPEKWSAEILASADRGGFVVRIKGPDGFVWEQRFEGRDEQAPAFVEWSVSAATR
jgi:hypothetical protein